MISEPPPRRAVLVVSGIVCALLSTACYTELKSRRRPAQEASARSAAEAHRKSVVEAEETRAKEKRDADEKAAALLNAPPVPKPETLVGRADDASFVAAGQRQTCAVRSDRVVCWGRAGPRPPETSMVSVAVGFPNACAIDRQGTVQCWGDNLYGALGDGTIDVRSGPVTVVGVSDAESVGAGFYAACVVRRGGAVACWGHNARGALGDGEEKTHRTPHPVAGLPPSVEVRGGEGFFCARTTSGEIYCWGDGRLGQGGDGKTGTKAEKRFPTKVPSLTEIVSLAAGRHHVCTADARGIVRCWGLQGAGVLGPRGGVSSAVPIEVPDLDGVVEVGASETMSCARRTNGEVWCWGNAPIPLPEKGVAITRDARPVPDMLGAVQIAVSEGSVCARLASGTVKCATR